MNQHIDDRSAFVIVTTHPSTGRAMFMVDRKKCTTRYWSYYLNNVFLYTTRESAQYRASRYKYNDPRVMSLYEAKKICENQTNDEYEAAGVDDA